MVLFTLIRFANATADSFASRFPSSSNRSRVLFCSKNFAICFPSTSLIFFQFMTRHLRDVLSLPSIDFVIAYSRRLIWPGFI